MRDVWSLDNFDNGYVNQRRMRCYSPNHPRSGSNGYVMRSILAYESYHNKPVPEGYHVHHVNGDTLDDSIENLIIMSTREHRKHHRSKMIGEKAPFWGRTHTDETKKKMSLHRIGWKPSDETIERMRIAHTGKKLSEETKQNLSQAMSGERNPMYGKKHTTETRKKISLSRIGEKHPNFGKKHSAITKQQMREAWVRRRSIQQGAVA